MARKQSRNAHGAGNLRRRANGLWEARYTYTDELGQTKRGSVYGETQKECRQKLTARLGEIDTGSFHGTAPKHYTVAEWFSEWLATYCINLKPMTVADYRSKADRYIIPNIGGVRLEALAPIQVQKLCNRLSKGYPGQKPLAPKTVSCVHGILHSALKQAVVAGMLRSNPADNTRLPKVRKPELKPLMDADISRFLQAIHGDRFETLFVVDLFSGLRQSELLGLQWEDVDFTQGVLRVRHQLQKLKCGEYVYLDLTKNGKERFAAIPPAIVKVLQKQKAIQAEWQLQAGGCWSNPHGLCSPMSWAGISGIRPYTITSRSAWLLSAWSPPASTICAIAARSLPFNPAAPSRPCRSSWATTPALSRWMFMALSVTPCARIHRPAWNRHSKRPEISKGYGVGYGKNAIQKCELFPCIFGNYEVKEPEA